jgi:predicted kinase
MAVGGLSGTGKTTVAAGLAPALAPPPGALHLRSDIERKRLARVGELDRLPSAAYTPEASAQIYTRLHDLARRALAAGHSVLIDAVYVRPDERNAAAQIARDSQVAFTGVWLDLPLEERVRRVSARAGDASDATAEVARAQENDDPGEISWLRVDASGTAEEVARRALRELQS